MPASRSSIVNALGAALFFMLAPGTLAGWLPWRITKWRLDGSYPGSGTWRVVGAVLIAAGVLGLIECFIRFVTRGRGTPAPVRAPTRLVVSGLYRHVRNPMYVCLVAIVAGQALLFGSRALAWYTLAGWGVFQLWVLGYEEPVLRDQFGGEYEAYRAAVRRWIPRWRPYSPPGSGGPPGKDTESAP